jgi:hypothetical protein
VVGVVGEDLHSDAEDDIQHLRLAVSGIQLAPGMTAVCPLGRHGSAHVGIAGLG